jgi:competence protein ComEC
MRNPLAAPALAFGLGILLARFTWFAAWEMVVCVLFFGVVGVGGWICRKGWMRWTGVLLALVALGAMNGQWRGGRAPPGGELASGKLQGCVAEPAVRHGDRRQFTLEVSEGRRVRLTVPEAVGNLEYGRRVEVEAKVRPVRGFHNPGAFDLEEWMGQRQIFWSGSAGSKGTVQVLPGQCGSRWGRALERLRARALARIDELYPGDDYHRAMMRGLLLGDKSEIRKAWIEDYRRTGTYHALVISGSHITLVCGLFLIWRRKFGYGERTLLVASALLAWLYALVAGGDAPVLRAAAGFTLFSCGSLLYRRKQVLNLLAAVVLAFLAVNPQQMFDASFQLSFLAVAAIGAFAPHRDHTEREPASRQALRLELRLVAETLHLMTGLKQGWGERVLNSVAGLVRMTWEAFWLSAAIQIGLALPMAIYFHRLSLTGCTANMLAVPAVSMAIPLGFASVFTGWRPPAELAGWLLDLSKAIVAWHAEWEPSWRIPDPPYWLAFLLTGVMVALAARWPRGRWLALPAAVCGVLLGALILHPFAPDRTAGSLELTAIDVGQGESLLVATPEGEIGLMDGGGIPQFGRQQTDRMDVGEDVVSPYLWSRGVSRLAFIAVTHLHDDHAGGVAALIENFRPRELWTGFAPENPLWRRIEAKALSVGTAVRVLKQGDHGEIGGVRWETLAPVDGQPWRGRAQNNDSLVLKLRYGRHTFLLTGDIESGVERRLLEQYQDLQADVLKVAHHGSRRSNLPSWLAGVQPSVALISAGQGNSYGLPHPKVVDELIARRTLILRTDLDGLSTVLSDGRYLQLGNQRQRSIPQRAEIWLGFGGDD